MYKHCCKNWEKSHGSQWNENHQWKAEIQRNIIYREKVCGNKTIYTFFVKCKLHSTQKTLSLVVAKDFDANSTESIARILARSFDNFPGICPEFPDLLDFTLDENWWLLYLKGNQLSRIGWSSCRFTSSHKLEKARNPDPDRKLWFSVTIQPFSLISQWIPKMCVVHAPWLANILRELGSPL